MRRQLDKDLESISTYFTIVDPKSLLEIVETKLRPPVEELQPLFAVERSHKLITLHKKAMNMTSHLLKRSSLKRSNTIQVTERHKEKFTSNTRHFVIIVVTIFLLYISLDLHAGLYKNAKEIVGAKYQTAYNLAQTQANLFAYAISVLSKTNRSSINDTFRSFQNSINEATFETHFKDDALNYVEVLRDFDTKENNFDLCQLNMLEEFDSVLALCQQYNPNLVWKPTYSHAKQKQEVLSNGETSPIGPLKDLNLTISNFNVDKKMLLTIIKSNWNSIMNVLNATATTMSTNVTSRVDPATISYLLRTMLTNFGYYDFYTDISFNFCVG